MTFARLRLALIVLVSPLVLSACSQATDNIGSNHMRVQAVQETALSYGAQSGLAWRSRQINNVLEKHDHTMARVFDFNAMIMQHNLMPPVLSEVDSTLHMADADTLRLSDRVVEILKPAHFVTTPPSWRDYLSLRFKQPDAPNRTLLPRNQEERQMWDEQVAIGWTQGMEQADAIFETNLGRLKEEFTGMVLYHTLLSQHMVSAPYVSQAQLGVTGNNKRMRLNDKVLRITAHANLQPNTTQRWTPVVRSQHDNADTH